MNDEENGEDEMDEQEAGDDEDEDEEGDDENNSCIVVYLQSEDTSPERGMILRFLEQAIDDEFFEQLRNKKQLGYYVSASCRYTRGIHGFQFIIQSSNYNPIELEKEIMTFIQNYLSTLDEEKFNKILKGLISLKEEPFKDIQEESDELFSCLKSYYESTE